MEPLPLEDNPPLPRPANKGISTAKILLYVLGLIILAAVVFLGLRYWNGAVSPFAFREFRSDDGLCRAELPGRAVPVSGQAYRSSDWSTRLHGEIGWYDLNTEEVKLARQEDLLASVRQRRGVAKPLREGVLKLGAFEGEEVAFEVNGERRLERYIAVLEGNNPRIYYIALCGPNFSFDSDAATRVMQSLRISAP